MITTIVIISLAALAVFILNADFSWSSVLASQRNELVFAGRNREYGAYRIRKEHHVSVIIALLISCGLSAGIAVLLSGTNSLQAVGQMDDEIIYIQNIEPLIIPETKIESARQSISNPPPPDPNLLPPEVVDNFKKKDENKKPVEPFVDPDPSPGPIGATPGIPGGVPGGTPGGSGSFTGDSSTVIPDKMPIYPGGEKALLEYLGKSVKYKELEIQNEVEGTIWITFVVSKNGNVRDVVVERGIRGGQRLEKEALKAVQCMPQWKPGIKNMQPVNVLYRVPFRFELK